MKKIVIINHYGITPETPGATRHYDLARFFEKKKQYSIEFWMCGYNHHTGKHIEELKNRIQYSYDDHGVKIVKLKSIPYRNNLIMRQLNIMFFDFLTGIKLLVSQNIKCVILSMPPISFFSTWICKRKKIKLIADVEDLWPLFLIDMGMNNKIAIKYMEWAANYTYNASDAFEAVSDGMIDFVSKKCSNKNKMRWLSPLGVNLELYNGKTNNKILNNYVWRDDFKIMYVGAHGKANDIESILETVKVFNDSSFNSIEKKIAFIFIGNGENKEYLINLAKRLDLKNVYFEDAISSNLVPEILKNADICLTNLMKINSFKLVRPNKIFQYMAAKKPILCGIWGETREIVEESDAGIYIDFTKYTEAANLIYNFITNSNMENRGKKGYEYILQKGNRQIIFEEFYKNLEIVIHR